MNRLIVLCWIFVPTICMCSLLQAGTRILVFPFEADNSVPRWEWLGPGLAAEIELRLLHVASVEVVRQPEYVALKQTLRVAQATGVDAFVRGSYRIVGDAVKVTAEVINTETPDLPRSFRGSAPTTNLLRALNDLCKSIPVVTGTRLMREEYGLLDNPTTSNPRAFESYVTGITPIAMNMMNPVGAQDSLVPAIVSLLKASDRDPGFYGAHYQLGWIHELSANHTRAIEVYAEALKRDPKIWRI